MRGLSKCLKTIIGVIAIASVVLNCENPLNVSGPSPVTPPDTGGNDFLQDPLIDINQTKVKRIGDMYYVNGERMRMFSAFSSMLAGAGYSSSLCYRAREHGFNTARIFTAQPDWDGWLSPFQRAPMFQYSGQNLRDVVDAYGSAGCAVQVVMESSWKGSGSLAEGKAHVSQVIQDLEGRKNVVYSVANEYHQGRISVRDIRQLLEYTKALGVRFVGLDEQSARPGHFSMDAFGFQKRLVDYCAWHPPRNVPQAETSQYYGRGKGLCGAKPTLYDELICDATIENLTDPVLKMWQGSSIIAGEGKLGVGKHEQKRLDKARLAQCKMNLVNVEAVGAIGCYHSLDLILCQKPPMDIRFPMM